MDVEFKTKEVDISNDDRPRLAKIRDYWTEEQTIKGVNLLKEYQYDFLRDYKDLKCLVQEMGEMKLQPLPDAKTIKKRPYKLANK